MPEDNSWTEWRRHVLEELKRQHSDIKDIQTSINKLELELNTLKVKASLLGGLSSIIVSLGLWYFKYIVTK